jgi:hypothetical protein
MAGVAFFLFPFWAPALNPSAAVGETAGALGAGSGVAALEGRTSLLLFSGAVAMILLAILSEAQHGLTMHTIAMLGALVGLNTALRMIDNLLPLPGGSRPSSC